MFVVNSCRDEEKWKQWRHQGLCQKHRNYLQTEVKLFVTLSRCAFCQVDDIFTEYESRIFGHQGMKGVDDQE